MAPVVRDEVREPAPDVPVTRPGSPAFDALTAMTAGLT